MLSYTPPLRDTEFLLFDLFQVDQQWPNIPAFADFSPDLVRAVINEGGRIAAEVLAPLNQVGDTEGCTWQDGEVSTPAGFVDGFGQLAAGGWLGLSGNPEFGGQGMPKVLGCLVEEMMWAANTALYLYGTLTVGTCICLDAHGTQEQKERYLPKLYSGEWTGAMALTEAHSGTDLGIMRTRAEPSADGSYRVTGTKIFITGGEHDLVENIVHLVLAKLPDAPAGSRGISLFIVPKFLVNDDGSLGARNQVNSGSIEHKMGIKGSATNVMNYDSAVGYLVGEENQGLAGMFTMMNYERLSVGLQGLGAGELAYQQAAAYAQDRLQGRSPTGPQNADGPADSLLVHPDVRRMLLTVRAYTEGGRAFAILVGQQLDLAKYTEDADERAAALARSELLTPIAKSFLTDRGFDCAVMAQQVFGGHGYVQEWGAEQIVRDARIGQIYEGTNGVQALDLIGRKVLKDGGRTLGLLIDEMQATQVEVSFQSALQQACERLRSVTQDLVERSAQDPNLAGAVSVDYLDLAGHVIYAWLWARMASQAPDDDYGVDKRQTAEFYFGRLLPKTLALEAGISADTSALMETSFVIR